MRTILEWENISVKKSRSVFAISDSFGSIREGKLTALIGPSNSGKSVLLQSLSGRIETKNSRGIVLMRTGEMNHELSTADSRRNHIGFVSNEDELMSTQTPREAFEFSLALKPSLGKSRRMKSSIKPPTPQLIEYYLSLFDLQSVADVPFNRLPSLNAKRFATIAAEMINERKILLLDSPLWGMFQVGGYQFIKVLKKLVSPEHGSKLAGILCSLQQPTSEILSLFDDVILMADGGQVIYQGPVGDMVDWFLKFGHECPPHYNVSDFALFVLHSIPVEERAAIVGAAKAKFDANRRRDSDCDDNNDWSSQRKNKKLLPSCFHCHVGPPHDTSRVDEISAEIRVQRPSFRTQLRMLSWREFHDIIRNWKAYLLTRFIVSIVVSVVMGLVYYQIAADVTVNSMPNKIHAYRGCVLVMCCNAMFANVQATVLALPIQRKLFQREYSLNMYSSIAYLVGKVPMEYLLASVQTLVQLLISYFLCGLAGNLGIYFLVLLVVTICADSVALSISCITNSPVSAIQMLPIALFPQIIFSGLIVSIASMPSWISWIQYICFMPYAMKLLTINEFGCTSITQFTNNDISCSNIALNATLLVCIAIFFRVAGLVALQFKPKTYK